MSNKVTSADPCPRCLLMNNVNNPLMDQPGQYYTSCRAGHKFEDTEELNNMRAQARMRYPELYRGPQAPVPPSPSELASRDIVIDPETKKAIEELANTVITGAADIKGLLFAHIRDSEDKDAELKSLRATIATMRSRASVPGGRSVALPNQVLITLPEWAIEGGIAEHANHAGKSVEDWVSEEINSYLENYFSRAPVRN